MHLERLRALAGINHDVTLGFLYDQGSGQLRVFGLSEFAIWSAIRSAKTGAEQPMIRAGTPSSQIPSEPGYDSRIPILPIVRSLAIIVGIHNQLKWLVQEGQFRCEGKRLGSRYFLDPRRQNAGQPRLLASLLAPFPDLCSLRNSAGSE